VSQRDSRNPNQIPAMPPRPPRSTAVNEKQLPPQSKGTQEPTVEPVIMASMTVDLGLMSTTLDAPCTLP